jgi:regulator of replication initiation timing
MQRIITQEEWQGLEEGVLQLVELCEALKRANQRLEEDNQRLREEKARLQDLLGEAEARLAPVLEQLRALEAQA